MVVGCVGGLVGFVAMFVAWFVGAELLVTFMAALGIEQNPIADAIGLLILIAEGIAVGFLAGWFAIRTVRRAAGLKTPREALVAAVTPQLGTGEIIEGMLVAALAHDAPAWTYGVSLPTAFLESTYQLVVTNRRLFLMGKGRWHRSGVYPVGEVRVTTLRLGAWSGSLSLDLGAGGLLTIVFNRSLKPSARHDPEDVVAALGGLSPESA